MSKKAETQIVRAETVVSQQQTEISAIASVAAGLRQARTAEAVCQFAGSLGMAAIKRMHDTKAYRLLTREALAAIGGVPIEKTPEKCDTWDAFCGFIGTSRQRTAEDFRQLEVLGEEFCARAAELDLPRATMRALMGSTDEIRSQAITLAKRTDALPNELREALTDLAKENAALAQERDSLKEEVAQKQEGIDKGCDQLRKLQEKAHKAQIELDLFRSGKKVGADDEEAIRTLGEMSSLVCGMFIRLRGVKWRKEDPCAVALAGLIEREASEYVGDLLQQHGTEVTDKRTKDLLAKVAKVAEASAEAIVGLPEIKKAVEKAAAKK